jgi:hypothetical protein
VQAEKKSFLCSTETDLARFSIRIGSKRPSSPR